MANSTTEQLFNNCKQFTDMHYSDAQVAKIYLNILATALQLPNQPTNQLTNNVSITRKHFYNNQTTISGNIDLLFIGVPHEFECMIGQSGSMMITKWTPVIDNRLVDCQSFVDMDPMLIGPNPNMFKDQILLVAQTQDLSLLGNSNWVRNIKIHSVIKGKDDCTIVHGIAIVYDFLIPLEYTFILKIVNNRLVITHWQYTDGHTTSLHCESFIEWIDEYSIDLVSTVGFIALQGGHSTPTDWRMIGQLVEGVYNHASGKYAVLFDPMQKIVLRWDCVQSNSVELSHCTKYLQWCDNVAVAPTYFTKMWDAAQRQPEFQFIHRQALGNCAYCGMVKINLNDKCGNWSYYNYSYDQATEEVLDWYHVWSDYDGDTAITNTEPKLSDKPISSESQFVGPKTHCDSFNQCGYCLSQTDEIVTKIQKTLNDYKRGANCDPNNGVVISSIMDDKQTYNTVIKGTISFKVFVSGGVMAYGFTCAHNPNGGISITDWTFMDAQYIGEQLSRDLPPVSWAVGPKGIDINDIAANLITIRDQLDILKTSLNIVLANVQKL